MNYKINFQSQDYLEHHGILGQRWGHRNGPPYPLDSEDHSSSEKKAGWRKSLKEEKKARDRAIQENYDNTIKSIESKYKRFQLMSDEDEQREEEAHDKAMADWAASEKRYKDEKKSNTRSKNS